jgi:hypothetical protein
LITTGDELAELLMRAQQIEEGFESVSQWEAYVRTKDPEFRRMIFHMLAETAKHRAVIGDLLQMVSVSEQPRIVPLSPTRFDFSGREQLEVMDELYQNELLMQDTYSLIRESLSGSDVENLLRPGQKEQFLKLLNELESDEGHHASLLSGHRGKMERIR